MSKRAKPKASTNIVNIKDYLKKASKKRQHILSLDLYKEIKTGEFSYTMTKRGRRKITDDFAAYGLTCVVDDIIAYCGNPEDIMELTQEIIQRLGYEPIEDDEDE